MKLRFFFTAILLSGFPLLSGAPPLGRALNLGRIIETKPNAEMQIPLMKSEKKPVQGKKAWKTLPVNTDNICVGVGGCKVEIPISREAATVFNTINSKAAFGKRDQKAIQAIVNDLREIRNNMENFGKKAKTVTDTALAVILHSTRWNDLKAQSTAIEYLKKLKTIKKWDKEKEAQWARIEEQCPLSAVL